MSINKIEKLDLECLFEAKRCNRVTTFANGEKSVETNIDAEVITGIKSIPNCELYSKINEIIDAINLLKNEKSQ